jgi:hypothetical protein
VAAEVSNVRNCYQRSLRLTWWASPQVKGVVVHICLFPKSRSFTDLHSRSIIFDLNIITIAVIVNTFRGAENGSLVAAKWWIVLWLTFVLSLPNIPIGLKRHSSAMGVMLILWCMITAAQPWLYFKGLDSGHRSGCIVKVFFFTGNNVYNHAWRTLWNGFR